MPDVNQDLESRAHTLAAGWHVLDAGALRALDLPQSNPLLGAILATGAITLLRGPSGAGKSLLALSIAHAIARGGTLLGWTAQPARVLYVDAVLPLATLQARVALLDRAAIGARPDTLRLLAADAQDSGPIELGTELGRAALTSRLDDVDLLVLDDLSTLVPSTRLVHWQPFAAWLAGLRRRGLAILLIDTWRRRRRNALLDGLLDSVVALSHPYDWDTEDGARIQVRLWARARAGAALRPFEARLQPTQSQPWTRIDAVDADAILVWRLFARQGFSLRNIATQLRFSTTTAHRLLTRARLLDPALRDESCKLDGTAGTDGTGGTDGTPGTPGTA